MINSYSRLLEPIQIGGVLFKNRLFSAPQGLHSLQGGETYPTDAIIATFANKAKGGAALVTCHGVSGGPVTPDGTRGNLSYDMTDMHSRHYIAKLADAIHFNGAKASMELSFVGESDYDVCDGYVAYGGKVCKALTPEMMAEIAENYAWQAKQVQELGYDMVMLHMGYRFTLGARFLSPATNKRTDEFGGPVENRARFPIMIFDAIKKACGKNFPIELRLSGQENIPNGITIEDTIHLASLLEGRVDLLHVHGSDAASSHCMDFQPDTPQLAMAEAIKKSGCTIPVVTIGGYQDLDEAESILQQGKADIICMARGWIADPNLGIKARSNRAQDVVPCIKCMKCHDTACIDNKTYRCSVNPTIGIEDRLSSIIKPPASKKIVAVIGGGPAGMNAALAASRQGHSVTLFEKSGVLGGQAVFSNYVPFKRSLRKYKDYLIRQLSLSDVNVVLNTTVEKSSLEDAGFDAVIVAVGAAPITPPIPGVDSANVITAPQVYGKESELPEKVVIIGGGQVGCETALHLALLGHRVSIIEMRDKLAPDASSSYRAALVSQIESNDNIDIILGARCTSVGKTVTYEREDAASIPADVVILAAGMKAKVQEAISFMDVAPHVELIGDCEGPGNISGATRSAFAAAMRL